MNVSLPADEKGGVQTFWHHFRIPIVLGVSSILLVALSIVLLIKSTQTVTPIRFSRDVLGSGIISSSSADRSDRLGSIVVDIEGAVVRPGIITLPEGSRVEDALTEVGGLRGDADSSYVAQKLNRAMKLTDGMKFYVPKVGEDETSHNIDPLLRSGSASQNGSSVSINTASKDELDLLPGVGPVTAQKIIDNRPYASLDDLVAKKAIGPSLLEKLKNQLSL